jgi:serine/threonine-protein kinase
MGIRKLGLLSRILAALLAVGILPWAIASFRLMGLNREAMTEQVLRTHAVAAQTTARRIEAFLQARTLVLGAVAADPVWSRDPRSPEAKELLAEVLRSPLELEAVVIRAADGAEVLRVQKKSWAKAAVALLQGPTAERVSAVAWEGEAVLRFDLPLSQARGTLSTLASLGPLTADLAPRELGPLTVLALVDRQGSLLAGDAGALEDLPPSLRNAALSGRLSGAGRYQDGEGQPVLGAFAEVEGVHWKVISRQPGSVAEATARQLRGRSWLAVLLTLIFTGALAWGAQRSLLTPIRELVAAQHRLAGAGEPASAAGNEIDQLRSSFELLERRLQEKQELDRVFLGRYQVLEIAGEGAMGTVFRGWDPALQRPVALKTVRFDVAAGEQRNEQAKRLVREAVAIARFSHPNIVGIYEVQESRDVAFLAMEFVEGQSVEASLEGHRPLSVAKVLRLGEGACQGLAAAHERGTVHRDVKPANILVGKDGSVKIADFGVSQMVSSPSDEVDEVCGTPGFIPPETLVGQGYSPAGDIFALGVTLYRLLTGSLPFRGDTLKEILGKTLRAEVLPPTTVVEGIPADLEKLVLEMLRRDPAERPTAAQALRRILALMPEEEEAAPAPPPPPSTRMAGGGLDQTRRLEGWQP